MSFRWFFAIAAVVLAGIALAEVRYGAYSFSAQVIREDEDNVENAGTCGEGADLGKRCFEDSECDGASTCTIDRIEILLALDPAFVTHPTYLEYYNPTGQTITTYTFGMSWEVPVTTPNSEVKVLEIDRALETVIIAEGDGWSVAAPPGVNVGVESGITADTGGTQASAYELTKAISVVDTATLNDSVKFESAASVGTYRVVDNRSGTAIRLFPPSGGEINNLGTDNQLTILDDNRAECQKVTATLWSCHSGAI